MVTLPVLVEIVSKLDCDVARVLSSIQANLLVGYAGGNDQLAVDTIANRFVQEHRKDIWTRDTGNKDHIALQE